MSKEIKSKNSFSKNVLTLMTGTTISQAIPIAISPILTRIYTPADFGLLGIFIAVSTIFGSIANGRYELAIMLPHKDEDAINIFALGFILNTILSLILFIVILIFNNQISVFFKNEQLTFWLYFIPITVFFIGLFNILNYFNNRKKNYKDIANATIIKSIVLAVIQLLIGFIKSGPTGLISGQIISQFFANTRLLKNILVDRQLLTRITRLKMISLAKRYKKFPKYSMWAGLLNILNNYVPTLVLSFYTYLNIVGFYMLAQRMLGVPTSFISSSFNQVLHKELVDIKEKNKIGLKVEDFVKVFIFLSMAPALFIIYTSPYFMGFIFGQNWSDSGIILAIITPFFALQFIFSPMSTVIAIMEWQKMGLIYQFISFLLGAISLYLGIVYYSPLLGILFYSISRSILVIFYRLIMLKYLEVHVINIIKIFFLNIIIYLPFGYILLDFIKYENYIMFSCFSLIYFLIYILIFRSYYKKRKKNEL